MAYTPRTSKTYPANGGFRKNYGFAPKKREVTEHPPTPQQTAILDAVNSGQAVTINAAAGAGKTSTLRMISKLPRISTQRVTYLAFNASIKKEAEETFPSNVTCKTGHGLAWNKTYGNRMEACGYRFPEDVAKIIGINSPTHFPGLPLLTPARQARLAAEMVTNFCNSADMEISAQLHAPLIPMLDRASSEYLAREMVGFAKKLWAMTSDLSANHGLWFTFSHYLKMFQLNVANGMPLNTPGVLLYDEAQDANPVILYLAKKMQANGAQLIAVGDRAQAIYGFTGAVDAMDHFGGTELELSKSFRFGPAVAAEANKWLDILNLSPMRVEGHEPIGSVLSNSDDWENAPDAILCRSNGGVIAEVMRLKEEGTAGVAVTDRVAGELKNMAEAALKLQNGEPCDHPELSAFKDWTKLQEAVEEDKSLGSLKRWVNAVDRHGAYNLIMTIRGLTRADGRQKVTVATAHGCKGLEFPSVKISDDFKAPDIEDENWSGEIDKDEAKLAYVTVTRAMKRLDVGSLSYVNDFWHGNE